MPRHLYVILFFSLLNVHSSLIAQTLQFKHEYASPDKGLDFLREMRTDKEGNIYIAATGTRPDKLQYMILEKLDASGHVQWVRIFNDSNLSIETSNMEIDEANNIYMLGTAHVGNRPFMQLLKYNAAGDLLRQKGFHGTDDICRAQDLCLGRSGPVLLGWNMNKRDDWDLYSLGLDTAWNVRFEASYDGGYNDYPRAMAMDISENVYITGTVTIVGLQYNIYVFKVDKTGKILWRNMYDGGLSGSDEPAEICTDRKGNVYVAGNSEGQSSGKDFVALKYNSKGKFQWERRFDGDHHLGDFANSSCLDKKGNFYLCGYTDNGGFNYSLATIKISKRGQLKWEFKYNGTSGSYTGYEIALDRSEYPCIAGTCVNSPQDLRYFFARLDKQGALLWSQLAPSDGRTCTGTQVWTGGPGLLFGGGFGRGRELDLAVYKYDFGTLKVPPKTSALTK